MGLDAAMTVQRACSEVTMPALEMEMLCCSIASWILVLSASFIWEREVHIKRERERRKERETCRTERPE